MKRTLNIMERRDLGLPLACVVMTANPLTEFMASKSGSVYYRACNAILQMLAPSPDMQASAKFGHACMFDAATILKLMPRDTTPDIQRFNASNKFLLDVYDMYDCAEWGFKELDQLIAFTRSFAESDRTVLHAEGQPSITDKATDAAAIALLAGAKVRGRFAGLDTFKSAAVPL